MASIRDRHEKVVMSRAHEAYLPIVLDAIRKRNSMNELFEFDMSARWGKTGGRMAQRAASNERLADRATGSHGAIGGVSQ